jgi:prepilin-type N-terminal cleavage/methylation domain-containing protein
MGSPAMGRNPRSPGRLGCRANPAAGFSFIEIVIAIAVMSIMATAMGSLLSATMYQSMKSRVDQQVRMLINREVDLFMFMPYQDLDPTVLASMNDGGGSWQQDPDTPTNTWDSFEGSIGYDKFLLNVQSQTTGRYHYLITRKLTLHPTDSNDPQQTPCKTIDLWIQSWGPSPNFQKLMSQANASARSADWQNDPNVVLETVKMNTIYRYP